MLLTRAYCFALFLTIAYGNHGFQHPRILGGEKVKQGQFPFVVALRSPNSVTDISTATVLTHNWLLTDGWGCFLIGQEIQAIVGTVNLNKGGRIVQIRQTILHPAWQQSDDAGMVHANDICLVELKTSVSYDDNVNQVTLPPPDYNFPQETLGSVMGWGTTTDNWMNVTNHLQIIRDLKSYRGSCPFFGLGGSPFEGQFCADSGKDGVTACYRDEGSPLVYNGSIQMGIHSFYIPNGPGVPCSRSRASAFTKVSHYVTWIQAVLGDEARFLKIATYDDVPKNS